jgi:predicted nucleotide-binding protein
MLLFRLQLRIVGVSPRSELTAGRCLVKKSTSLSSDLPLSVLDYNLSYLSQKSVLSFTWGTETPMNSAVDEFRALLSRHKCVIQSEKALNNDTGYQFRLLGGQIACLFETGVRQKQGKRWESLPQEIQDFMGGVSSGDPISRKVFVVYGHDEQARDELERLLRKWQLDPLILDQLPSTGKTLIEKLEAFRDSGSYAVVLATPDDEGFPSGQEDKRFFRARQNVVLELGMMLAVLGRERVAILLKDGGQMERPSDIQGLIYIPFKVNVSEAKVQLAQEMNAVGLTIDVAHL